MDRRSFTLAAMGALAAGAGRARDLRKVKFTQPESPAGDAIVARRRVPGPAPGDRLIQMQPMAATRPDETHAFLAVSRQAFGADAPFRFAGQMRTVAQLRTPAPNAWEVAWLVWNFADNDHLYYFVLKPNGWEIGKRDPRYRVPGVNDGQKIIATGESARLKMGQWVAFDLRVDGAEADISIDGRFVTRFRDTDPAPLLAGRVGLYGEDAVCQWHDITAPVADSFADEGPQPFADGTRLAHWDIAFLGYGAGGIVSA
jgi:hypothetical protein